MRCKGSRPLCLSAEPAQEAIRITTAVLASAYFDRPVRTDTAMTGEITLSGLVLPVGGIKEKVLAAHRSGIRRIILPKANEKDLEEVPEEVRQDLAFVLVERIEEVLPTNFTAREPEHSDRGRQGAPDGHAVAVHA